MIGNRMEDKLMKLSQIGLSCGGALAVIALFGVPTSALASLPEFEPKCQASEPANYLTLEDCEKEQNSGNYKKGWEKAYGFTFTTKGGKSKFEQKEGLAAITSEKSTGSGAVSSGKEGSFEELYEGVTAPLSGKCTSLTATTKGTVGVKGSYKIGYLDSAKTKVGIAFMIAETHFECEKLISLVTVRGCAVGTVTPLNTKTKTLEAILTQTKGINAFTTILEADNSTTKSCKLEAEINGGAFVQTGEEETAAITVSGETSILA